MAEKSILDARLAEIDRRLRTIQSGLAPAAEAASAHGVADDPQLVAPEAAPVPQRLSAPASQRMSEALAPEFAARVDSNDASGLVAELRALVHAHERLLASARQLHAQGRERKLPGASVSLSAGPFGDTEALRRFEQSLQALPGVSHVALREYEGADRAVIDVHLAQPNP